MGMTAGVCGVVDNMAVGISESGECTERCRFIVVDVVHSGVSAVTIVLTMSIPTWHMRKPQLVFIKL